MPTSSYITPVILTSLAATVAYASYASTRLYRPTPSQGLAPIVFSTHIPPSFEKSNTVTKIINPGGFRSWDDSRSVTLRLPSGARGWTDEQVLARFTTGFFGGWVFGPERVALNAAGFQRKLVNFPLQGSSPAAAVWKSSDISSETLPELDSIFFGAFQVVDKNPEPDDSGEAYIDFAYGSSQRSFAGVHRFSVHRLDRKDASGGSEEGRVQLRMSCVTCNPQEDKRVAPEWSSTLHRTYAMLLFREGVAEVAR